jgi:competence protein CoiA
MFPLRERGNTMLNARCKTGDILASDAVKADGPFHCPMCDEAVVLKKGRVKIHHFAHLPPYNCAYGTGETEQHRQVKLAIYRALAKHPEVSKLQVERSLGDVRPDISFYLGKTPIAIEVQVSTLSLDTIDKRTRSYMEKGISLLWTSPFGSTLWHGEQYSPKQWEKYLHSLYFGKVYYWIEGEKLLPVHFADYLIHVEASTWYDSYGTEQYGGGYEYTSKRYRTAYFRPQTYITALTTVNRKAWSSSKMTIPAAKLWCEAYRPRN